MQCFKRKKRYISSKIVTVITVIQIDLQEFLKWNFETLQFRIEYFFMCLLLQLQLLPPLHNVLFLSMTLSWKVCSFISTL